MLPDRDPENKFIEPLKQIEICKFILQNLLECYESSPALFIEDKLFEQRYKNLQRNIDSCDYRDSMHAIVGLGYCDKFISDDKALIRDLQALKKNYPNFKLAEISRTIDL